MISATSFCIHAYYDFLFYHTRMMFKFSEMMLFEMKTEPVYEGDTERVRRGIYQRRWHGNKSRQDRSGDEAGDHKRMAYGTENRV